MRTTLTLDEEIADQLANLARETNRPFKSIVNDTLRRGLREAVPTEAPFQIKPHAGGLRPGIDDRRLNELAFELHNDRLPAK